MATSNQYSRTWFELFLGNTQSAQAQKEADFITRVLPVPTHRRLLDLCCGTGRHMGPLCNLGYQVVGFDRSWIAITRAKEQYPLCSFVAADMNALPFKPASFYAAICIWQSFGYFDDATNCNVLKQIRTVL